MAHQPTRPATYFLIYVTLLGLTALTVLIARNQDALHLHRYEIAIALGIASMKTILVGLFFMHLLHSSKLAWMSLAVAILFLAGMIVLTMADYWTRGWIPVRPLPVGWLLW